MPPGSTARSEAASANDKSTGTTYVSNIPATVPSNTNAEYPNCVKAVRAIRSRISPEVLICAQAHAFPCQTHPDVPTAALHCPSQRAIVNHFGSNGRNSSNACQRLLPQKNATARGPGGF